MKYTLIFFLFFSIPVFASNSLDFQWLVDIGQKFNDFFEYTPNFIERMFSYILQYAIKLKLMLMVSAMKFSYGVAIELINDLSIYEFINTAFSSLSPDMQQAAGAYGIGAAIMRIIEAMTTRFVMNFMGI